MVAGREERLRKKSFNLKGKLEGILKTYQLKTVNFKDYMVF